MLRFVSSPNMLKKWQDILRLLGMFNAPKLWNLLLVQSSYLFARITHKPRILGLPLSMSVEPTTSCNLRCPECVSGLQAFKRPTGMLDPAFYQLKIDKWKKHLVYLTLYFQGEPYLHPQFFDLVQYASSRKIYTSTSTNAHFLNPENAKATVLSGLHRLIVSLDGTTQATYEKYRIGGNMNSVLEGIKTLVESKRKLNSKTPYIILQFIVFRTNENEVEAVKRLGKDLGVDSVQIKTAQLTDYKMGNPLMPENAKYSRYKKMQDGTYEIKSKYSNRCWRMWHAAVMSWDGQMLPCCFDKNAEYEMGNLKHQTLREIWNNPIYSKFRQKLFSNRKSIDICQNCTEGLKVWSS